MIQFHGEFLTALIVGLLASILHLCSALKAVGAVSAVLVRSVLIFDRNPLTGIFFSPKKKINK